MARQHRRRVLAAVAKYQAANGNRSSGAARHGKSMFGEEHWAKFIALDRDIGQEDVRRDQFDVEQTTSQRQHRVVAGGKASRFWVGGATTACRLVYLELTPNRSTD